MSEREESVTERIRVLFGHYYCPDCYRWKCTDKCGRRHQRELSEISEIIGREEFTIAHERIDELEREIDDGFGLSDPEIIRLRTLMSFLEGED